MKTLALSSRIGKEIYRDPLSLVLGLALPLGLLGLYTFINSRVPVAAVIFSPAMMTPAVASFGFAFIIMFLATLLAKDRRSSSLTAAWSVHTLSFSSVPWAMKLFYH